MSNGRNPYLELACRAGEHERGKNWLEAANLWLGACQNARGLDLEWSQVRFDFCCIRYGIHPGKFFSCYLRDKKVLSPFASVDVVCLEGEGEGEGEDV